jgi:hypothetical protein
MFSSFMLNHSSRIDMSFASKTSEPKIPNKVEKAKFEFIFKRSVYRHMCAFYKEKFIAYTLGKKVH